MRQDSVGFFWQELEVKTEKKGREPARPRSLPPIPDTGWIPPKEFPRLDNAKVIAIDCETKDLELFDKGPGVRRDGHIVGLAVGTDDGGRWYFPMRHEVGSELNIDPDKVIEWARNELTRASQPKIGANLSYDLDYLYEAGVKVAGKFIDVQIAEPLLDDNRRQYNLDALASTHLGEEKVKDDLKEWVFKAYRTKNYREDIYRSPPQLVGPYAEGDVDLPLRIFEKQKPLLEEQGLMQLFDIESRLLPLMVDMRRRGVKVDLVRAQALDDELTNAIALAQARLNAAAGTTVDVNKSSTIVRLFDKLGLTYPRTTKGAPSFVKEFLEHHPHPSAQLIVEVRKLTKLRDTFIRAYIFGTHINGRIHCLFHQLKGDDNGTVSGRFSSSCPNLQNIPSRDPVWGPKIRSMFIPEDGETWVKHDWSQIEYRFLAHYGVGKNGEEVRELYRTNPATDFHVMVVELTGLDRKPAKSINFGLVYGMGKSTLAYRMGMTLEEADEKIFSVYHGRVPFVKDTYERASSRAATRGFVKTILGRRARFESWVPGNAFGRDDIVGLPRKAAIAKHGTGVKRGYTHKALNRILQGSAADLMKLAMVEIYESGIPDVLGVPLLTVHDELDHSKPKTKKGDEAVREVKNIMETCQKLKVPIISEQEEGPNWGDVK